MYPLIVLLLLEKGEPFAWGMLPDSNTAIISISGPGIDAHSFMDQWQPHPMP